jgi:phage terminase small subunit
MDTPNDGMKPQFKVFAEKYLICQNATQAAREAGYSEKSARQQGSRLLNNAAIRLYIDQLRAETVEKTGETIEDILKDLRETVRRCMQPVQVVDRAGKLVFTVDEKGNSVPVMANVDTAGANKAIELIGKHLGAFDPDRMAKDDRLQFVGITIVMGSREIPNAEWLLFQQWKKTLPADNPYMIELARNDLRPAISSNN